LSLQLVNAVVKDWACECVFFFNYNRVSMGLGNDAVKPHMDALFGPERSEALRVELEGMAPADRELAVIEALSQSLNPTGNRFVLPFRFRNERGTRTSHHLIFVSKNFLGYHIMKGVMARESSAQPEGVPSFEYSPADRRFPVLFNLSAPLSDLEGTLLSEFGGRTLPFQQLYQAHSVGKPFIDSNYKQVLKSMEERGIISAVKPGKNRRRGTFADDVMITFPPKGS